MNSEINKRILAVNIKAFEDFTQDEYHQYVTNSAVLYLKLLKSHSSADSFDEFIKGFAHEK